MIKRLIFVLGLALILTGCGQPDGNPAGKEEPKAGIQEGQRYTLEMFMQIDMGDSYEEVQALLGDPGESMDDNERLKQYQWTNEDESQINVTFYDNEATAKSQAYLGSLLSGKQAVNLAMYNKLTEGMAIGEVEDILGAGTLRMLALVEGEEEMILAWDNSDGSGISVTFLEGKVTKTSKIMLK